MIRFHPSNQQLVNFVEGSLSPAVSIMVSAHCDMCPLCQRVVEVETERLASELFEENLLPAREEASGFSFADASPRYSTSSLVSSSSMFDNMLANIIQMPDAKSVDGKIQSRGTRSPANVSSWSEADTHKIELDGRVFTVPRTLRRYVGKTGNWSSLVGKLWQAPVDLGNQGVANFIFMGQGGSVPEHTHRGTEYTLVIDGEFSDGLNKYDTGDFIFMDGQNTHTPRADAKDGCLVFSIVDQPLHFTSGIARLLNPFSHLFFR